MVKHLLSTSGKLQAAATQLQDSISVDISLYSILGVGANYIRIDKLYYCPKKHCQVAVVAIMPVALVTCLQTPRPETCHKEYNVYIHLFSISPDYVLASIAGATKENIYKSLYGMDCRPILESVDKVLS